MNSSLSLEILSQTRIVFPTPAFPTNITGFPFCRSNSMKYVKQIVSADCTNTVCTHEQNFKRWIFAALWLFLNFGWTVPFRLSRKLNCVKLFYENKVYKTDHIFCILYFFFITDLQRDVGFQLKRRCAFTPRSEPFGVGVDVVIKHWTLRGKLHSSHFLTPPTTELWTIVY